MGQFVSISKIFQRKMNGIDFEGRAERFSLFVYA